MALKVRLAPRAARDLRDIRAYLLTRSPAGADNVRAAINRTIRLLLRHPGVGRPTHIAGVHMLSTAKYPYVVYHMVTPAELVVVHVRHGSRSAPSADDLTP